MNHTDFTTLYTGKYYNYDNAYWPECVDLFKGYYRDVKWYIITVALGTAYNYWLNIEKTGLVKTVSPKEGDAVFSKFKIWTVEYGHVGIFEKYGHENGVDGWYQFDQLWDWEPNIGKEKPCKSRFYPFSKLYGYATLPDNVDARVQRFVKKYKLQQPSKTKNYSQYDTCIILSLMDETNH